VDQLVRFGFLHEAFLLNHLNKRGRIFLSGINQIDIFLGTLPLTNSEIPYGVIGNDCGTKEIGQKLIMWKMNIHYVHRIETNGDL